MIRRAVSRSARARLANTPPRPTAAEVRKQVSLQVDRVNAAVAWNNRLSRELEEAEHEVNVVRNVLDIDTFPPAVLCGIIAESKEEILGIIESHEQLQKEIGELRLGVASLPEGSVSGLTEGVQRLEYVSTPLGEHLEWLQQELADLSVEFEPRMISTHAIEQSPGAAPASDSPSKRPSSNCPGLKLPSSSQLGQPKGPPTTSLR